MIDPRVEIILDALQCERGREESEAAGNLSRVCE